MQEQRREEHPAAYAPDGSHLKAAAKYWERLSARDPLQLAAIPQFQLAPRKRPGVPFLEPGCPGGPAGPASGFGAARIDKPTIPCWNWPRCSTLINVKDVYPLGRDIVGPKDLKEGHFFQGPHELKKPPRSSTGSAPTCRACARRPRLCAASRSTWPTPPTGSNHFRGFISTICSGRGTRSSRRACLSFSSAQSKKRLRRTPSGAWSIGCRRRC